MSDAPMTGGNGTPPLEAMNAIKTKLRTELAPETLLAYLCIVGCDLVNQPSHQHHRPEWEQVLPSHHY